MTGVKSVTVNQCPLVPFTFWSFAVFAIQRHQFFAAFAILSCMIAGQTSTYAQSMLQRFERIDRNGDDEITSEETGNADWFNRILQRFDRNKDGVLQKSEVSRRPNVGESRDSDQEYATPQTPEYKSVRDVPYDSDDRVDSRELSLDLYLPETASGDGHPVLVMIHGGGWRGGDKASPAIVGSKMAHFVKQGYIYASINYRLAPERPGTKGIQHPTQVQDCANAIAWIHSNIAKHGGDPNNIHLMGHSAGAHLAALVGTNERFLKAAGKDLSVIKTNVLLDPAALDVPRYIEINRGRGMTQLYDHVFGNTEEARRDASPQQHIQKNKPIPPTIIFYAGNRMNLDVLGPAFASAMTDAGIPAKAIDTVILDHGQINSRIGLVDEPMTKLIRQLHAGKDAQKFPSSIGPKLTPEEAQERLDAANEAARKKREQRRDLIRKRSPQ